MTLANAAPAVVPSVREWSGGFGVMRLEQGARLVVDHASELADEVETLRVDLRKVSGLNLPIVSAHQPAAGDIFLSLRGADQELGVEGYQLSVDDSAQVRANTTAGLFYGTQVLLQILKITSGHRTFLRGEARDWPRQQERGFLLDVGRKYWSPDFIVQAIRDMAYLRLNTLQLHFSDNNAFRLMSDQFPALAAPQAYTKADIRRFEAEARRYHVTIIPEIEMPAHAQAILNVRPDLRFDCAEFADAGTLDVTKPETRRFTAQVINEFAPLFSGPEFHIAADEYPTQTAQERCPALVRYAREHGLDSTADVFVDFINEMNGVVRSHGKRMVIWNWWDVDQNPTIQPDRSIKIESWTTGPEPYLAQGYDVVASPSDLLYVTPGFPLLPDPQFLYEEWIPVEHPNLSGYQISVWADKVETHPDSYFDAHLRRPRQVLADRLWGGPRVGSVADFFTRVDALCSPSVVSPYALTTESSGDSAGADAAHADPMNPVSEEHDKDRG